MLGAIIGDIVGSVYEFNNYKAKDFQPFFHPKGFFTDDTVCTVAIADALLNQRDPAIALREWCRRYWHIGGWGLRYADWVKSDVMGPYNSMGNGAAMRVSPAGFIANSIEEAINLAHRVTEVTHNHPEGLKGAAATAVAIYLAKTKHNTEQIRDFISTEFDYDLDRTVDEIRAVYEYNELSPTTVPEALICALDATGYEDAVRNAISIGGDSDTIAAIAGSVAEAMFGLNDAILLTGLAIVPGDMKDILLNLYTNSMSSNGGSSITVFLKN
jgi:ADP-ribosyl-[dinitrogen reductase] hydrolase